MLFCIPFKERISWLICFSLPCRSFLKGLVAHPTKVTFLLTTFLSWLPLVNACCPHLRQHHSTATLKVVCVPGLKTGLTGLTGQDTGVLPVVF